MKRNKLGISSRRCQNKGEISSRRGQNKGEISSRRGQNKGQITIFVIVGIILISAIIMFFLFRENTVIKKTGKPEESPESFLNLCLNDEVKTAIDDISLHGGYMKNPNSLNFKFGNETPVNISYLCYTQNYYADRKSVV